MLCYTRYSDQIWRFFHRLAPAYAACGGMNLEGFIVDQYNRKTMGRENEKKKGKIKC